MSHTPGVWIVRHDDSPHHRVVGVFANLGEAASFAERMQDRFENGLFYARYEIGYRFDAGSSGYSSSS
ncbi:hypothetical protein [Paeniglutamicibacter cryotolerans]|uniref:SPOR domain-containing protein n=1 Tax=Paeniglutamicibacter cryotolerans TaxID=670079 RepID=A0A839QEJ3_9MICC|nr:hypothetical protein [Paeniglutamicibacter cryotolerans]MBB2994023.1 hypothetical protein [Paeniglutamicibacter cryotolerans]